MALDLKIWNNCNAYFKARPDIGANTYEVVVGEDIFGLDKDIHDEIVSFVICNEFNNFYFYTARYTHVAGKTIGMLFFDYSEPSEIIFLKTSIFNCILPS